MLIQSTFEVAVPVPQAWALLTDIKDIAPCMPGAQLTEVLDDNSYRGNVTVRLGPVTLTFDGTARFDEMDTDACRARVSAQGSDKKGRGGATADITFRLEPIDQGTKVLIDTELNLSGSVAQYGRGAGMINELASQLVSQFAESLHEKISATGDETLPAEEIASASIPPKPIPILGLAARSIWASFVKALKGMFGRT